MNIIKKILAGLNLVGELAQIAMEIKAGKQPNTDGFAGELHDVLINGFGLKLKTATQAEFVTAVDALVNLFY